VINSSTDIIFIIIYYNAVVFNRLVFQAQPRIY